MRSGPGWRAAPRRPRRRDGRGCSATSQTPDFWPAADRTGRPGNRARTIRRAAGPDQRRRAGGEPDHQQREPAHRHHGDPARLTDHLGNRPDAQRHPGPHRNRPGPGQRDTQQDEPHQVTEQVGHDQPADHRVALEPGDQPGRGSPVRLPRRGVHHHILGQQVPGTQRRRERHRRPRRRQPRSTGTGHETGVQHRRQQQQDRKIQNQRQPHRRQVRRRRGHLGRRRVRLLHRRDQKLHQLPDRAHQQAGHARCHPPPRQHHHAPPRREPDRHHRRTLSSIPSGAVPETETGVPAPRESAPTADRRPRVRTGYCRRHRQAFHPTRGIADGRTVRQGRFRYCSEGCAGRVRVPMQKGCPAGSIITRLP
jgi:hypothetical protein